MAKQAKVWDGSQWVDVLSSTSKVVYYQANEPTIANEGDIWVDSDDEILGSTGAQGATGATGATGAGVPVGGTTGQVLSKVSNTNYDTQWSTVSGGTASLLLTRNTQTASYSLVTGDLDKLVEMNVASANNVTVGTSLNSMAEGSQIHLLQTGAGQTTVVASGVTVNGTPGLKLRAQWSSATLIKRSAANASGVWVIIGDLSS